MLDPFVWFDPAAMNDTVDEIFDYYGQLGDERRSEPTDDLISAKEGIFLAVTRVPITKRSVSPTTHVADVRLHACYNGFAKNVSDLCLLFDSLPRDWPGRQSLHELARNHARSYLSERTIRQKAARLTLNRPNLR